MTRQVGAHGVAWVLPLLLAWGCGDGASGLGSGDRSAVLIGTLLRDDGDGADQVLALRDINGAGGLSIDGEEHQLELVRISQGDSGETGAAAVRSLAARGVTGIVGPVWSSVTLGAAADFSDGAAQAAFNEGVLLVSGNATSALITDLDDDDLMWRTVPSDDFQGALGAQYLFDRGARTAAVLFRDEAWGQGLSDSFIAAFERLGGEVLASEGYPVDVDLNRYTFPELDSVFERQPEVVYLACFEELAQVANRIEHGRHLQAYGDEPPTFMGTDGAFGAEILNNSPAAVLDNLVGTAPGYDRTDRFVEAYLQRYEDAGLGDAVLAWPYLYDATFVIALAMQAAQSTDPAEFKHEMRAISRDDGDGDVVIRAGQWAKARAALLRGEPVNYEGLSGPLDFTEAGDPEQASYTLWKPVQDADGTYDFDVSETIGTP